MKDYTVVFTPRAEHQLRSLNGYIANRSGEVRADTFVAGIVTDCPALSTFPERGTLRDDIRPDLRIKGYKRRVTIAFSVDRVRDAVVCLLRRTGF